MSKSYRHAYSFVFFLAVISASASCGVRAGVEKLGGEIIKAGNFPDGSVIDYASEAGQRPDSQWTLMQKDPGKGKFETAGAVCKVIPDNPGSDPSLVTLAYYPCPVIFGRAYRVSFDVKADSKRSILVRIKRIGGDSLAYSGLRSFDAGTDWQTISFLFKSLATDGFARFELECAGEKPALYFRKVSLRPVLE
jgi:hypothetical protein